MERPGVGSEGVSVFIADANVLIDYMNADLAVLGLFARHVGTVYVLGVLIRNEVDDLTEAQCEKSGLTVIEAATETLLEAGERSEGSLLSFIDWLCLLEAKKRRAYCLTSDGALLKICKQEGVNTRRGLAPLLELVSLGHLSMKSALGLAKRIAEMNSYLEKVLPSFEQEVLARSKKKGE